MIVKICNSCGKRVHVGSYYGNICMFCDSEVKFEEPDTKVYEAVIKCEEILVGRVEMSMENFIFYINSLIEKYPQVSALYWLRMLAKNRCSNDMYLLEKGIRFTDNADYFAAYDCADDNERLYYNSLAKIYETLQEQLFKELNIKKQSEINSTGIQQKQKEIYEKLFELTSELSKQMEEFSLTEMLLKDRISDCEAYYESLRVITESAEYKISNISEEINKKSEITDEGKSEQLSLILKNFKASEFTLSKAREFENSETYKEYIALLTQCEEEKKSIDNLTNRINKLDSEMKKIITDVEKIKKKYEDIVKYSKTSDYSKMAYVLGNSKINRRLTTILKSQDRSRQRDCFDPA